VYCGAIAIIFLFVIMMVTRPADAADVKITKTHRYLVVFVVVAIAIGNIADNNNNLVNFVHLTNWASEFILLTDLHLFACMVYIGYPTA
jgi:putative copper export protein